MWLEWSLEARAAMRWDLEGNAYGLYRINLTEFGTALVVFLPGFRLLLSRVSSVSFFASSG